MDFWRRMLLQSGAKQFPEKYQVRQQSLPSATGRKPATGAESEELVINNEESENEFFSKL